MCYVIIEFVIKSFADSRTEKLWRIGKARRLPANLSRVALRKLAMLHTVTDLRDLAVLPGNRLEALHGDRQGQHSIRINDQFRICFFWRDGNAH